jgi:hypothetical protein
MHTLYGVFIHGVHMEYLNVRYSDPVKREENMPSPHMFGKEALLLITKTF